MTVLGRVFLGLTILWHWACSPVFKERQTEIRCNTGYIHRGAQYSNMISMEGRKRGGRGDKQVEYKIQLQPRCAKLQPPPSRSHARGDRLETPFSTVTEASPNLE